MTTAPTVAAEPPPEEIGSSGVSDRPVWVLTGEQMLTELDALHVEMCRVETRRLALLAELDQIGHARDIGARGTAELIARRHRLDAAQVYRDLKLAKALPRYPLRPPSPEQRPAHRPPPPGP